MSKFAVVFGTVALVYEFELWKLIMYCGIYTEPLGECSDCFFLSSRSALYMRNDYWRPFVSVKVRFLPCAMSREVLEVILPLKWTCSVYIGIL